MKTQLALLACASLLFAGCKKKGFCDNCYAMQPAFFFIIADSGGNSLFTSTADDITFSYWEGGKLITSLDHNHPFPVSNAPVAFVVDDLLMAGLSYGHGTRTFYLTFKGQTDTLGLDIHAVPATPDNGGNSTPIVTFNGRSVPMTLGGEVMDNYFVLRRR